MGEHKKLSVNLDGDLYDELSTLVERWNELHPHAQTSRGAVLNQALAYWLPEFRADVAALERDRDVRPRDRPDRK
jgi:hypothetical protein